jgi:hypothetical protein
MQSVTSKPASGVAGCTTNPYSGDIKMAYSVSIQWYYDDSVSVHHFTEYPDAESFYRRAVEDADYYLDAHHVILKEKESGENKAWKIYK